MHLSGYINISLNQAVEKFEKLGFKKTTIIAGAVFLERKSNLIIERVRINKSPKLVLKNTSWRLDDIKNVKNQGVFIECFEIPANKDLK